MTNQRVERVDTVSPAVGGAQHRQIPGVLIVDESDRVVLVNERARRQLGDIAGAELHGERASELPPVLQALVPELRTRLKERMDTHAVALLTVDICARACLLDGSAGRSMLLLFERVERKDAVKHNLERFNLTKREGEVVMLVLYGHSNRRIADQLFLTEYTVEDHLKRIFTKIGTRTRTALVSKVLGWREL